jgi:hypothetical protein
MVRDKYKWVAHGFYFDTETDYNLALKDEEKYKYIMNQVASNNDKTILIEVFNKLNESEKFKTVVGMARLNELQNYIIREGIATEADILPIEGFTVRKLHSASGYSRIQMDNMKREMEKANKEKVIKYKSSINTMKITICVLCVLVATLFYFGINKNNASNYASAKENVIDEYVQWENELTEREQKVKEREEALKEKEKALNEVNN